jgi:inorganic pyrophosphatase
MPHHDIARMRPFGPKSEYINATPKGSLTKFKYDDESGLFLFDKAMPTGQTFPFDFGFLPSTLGDDGDPLDVLVLTEEPTFVGCLIHGKLLGVIEAEQGENGETDRNDRLIAVPLEVKSGKLPARATCKLDSAVALRYAGPERAEQLIRIGISNLRKRLLKKSSSSSKSRR